MEYQKIRNLVGETSKEFPRFTERKWVVIIDNRRGNYSSKEIKFETTTQRSSLCDYSDAYILVKGIVTIVGEAPAGTADNAKAAAIAADRTGKEICLKNCTPFTKCIPSINKQQVDDANDLDVVMPMYNLLEYSKNYQEASGSIWNFHRE